MKGTPNFGILYVVSCTLDIVGYIDPDWPSDGTDRKSTFGYVFNFFSGPICWSSKKQSTLALSSAEVEYMGVVNATTHVVWL